MRHCRGGTCADCMERRLLAHTVNHRERMGFLVKRIDILVFCCRKHVKRLRKLDTSRAISDGAAR